LKSAEYRFRLPVIPVRPSQEQTELKPLSDFQGPPQRAGFVTTAYKNGVPDEEIMGHTRHRSLTTMRSYVRRAKLGSQSPAGKLGL
jgi:hypothetical protein